MYDAHGYVKRVHEQLEHGQSNNYTFLSRIERNWNIYLESINYKPADFQAVIALPYTHIGSEKIWLLKNAEQDWTQVLSWRVCVQTGLPLVNVMMSRTSWKQTFDQVRLGGGPLTHKPILETGDDRPFLVLVMEQNPITDPDTKWILAASEKIGFHSDLIVYKLYPDKLKQADRLYKASLTAAASSIGIGDHLISGTGVWYVNHFDHDGGDSILFGSGAAKLIKGHRLLTTVHVPYYRTAGPHEFSLWFRADDKNSMTPDLQIEFLDEQGDPLDNATLHTSWSTDNKGMWMRASDFINIPSQCRQIRLKVFDEETNYSGVDELMIRPAGAIIMSKSKDGTVMANNHFLYGP
jgi:hypothetical protein